MTLSNTPTPAPAPAATPSVSLSVTPSTSPFNSSRTLPIDSAFVKASEPVASPIIGGAVVGVTLILLASAALAYNVNRGFRSAVSKYAGIKDARSPVTSQSIITMNPANHVEMTYHNNT